MGRTPLIRRLILALQNARHEYLKEQQLPLPIPKELADTSRRRFIKTSTLASLLGLSGGLTTNAFAIPTGFRSNVVIIGAGLAGLNAAYQLKQVGISADVYEARNRVGGRTFSKQIQNGLTVDIGAELINTDHADMLDLVADFDIKLFNKLEDADSLPYPKEAFYFNGVSRTEAELADDLRAIAAQIAIDSALLDEDWDTNAPFFDQLSVADYLELHADKIPKLYVKQLLHSMIHTEYGVEANASSALQLITILPVVNGQHVDLLSYSDEAFAVVGGSQQIAHAIANTLGKQVHLNKRLTTISQADASYTLSFADGSVINADYVIIAIPFPALNTVTLNVKLPTRLKQFIEQGKLGSNEKVIAGFSNRFWRQDSGFTLAAWGVKGVSEIWDETQRQPERNDAALNFFLGGKQARELANVANIDALAQQFTERLDAFIPGAKTAFTGHVVKSSWTQSPYTQGGYANFKPGQLTRFSDYFWIDSNNPDEQQQVNVGNLIFAGEHLSDAFYGFMNGAAETGRLAANLVITQMANS